MPLKDRDKYKNLGLYDLVIAQRELIEQRYDFKITTRKTKCSYIPRYDIEILDKKKIKVGNHVKTNEKYNSKIYEPLYHEKILDAIVLNIDKDNVFTYKIIETSCDFSKRFNYHMDKWKTGSVKNTGLDWLELKED